MKKKEKMALQEQGNEAEYFLATAGTRLSILENKYNMISEKLLAINQNMIVEYKKTLSEIGSFAKEIKDLKSQINALKESIISVSKELSFFARKESIKELEKYINLWHPLSFTTEDEVKRIIREETKKRGNE